MCVFSLQGLPEASNSMNNSVKYYHKRTQVYMQSTKLFLPESENLNFLNMFLKNTQT